MADHGIEEEEEKEIISPETIIEWERIQFPLDHTQSPSSTTVRFDGGSMVDDDDHPHPQIVFPPVNHEGLHIFTHHDVRDIDLDRVVQSSPLPSPRHRPPPVWNETAAGWWDVGLELLHFKVANIVTSFRNFAAARGFPTSFRTRGYVVPLAGSVLLLLLYLRSRRRRRLRRENLVDLIRGIKEKDEEILQKINLLVHQIAQLNNSLTASHHRVPIPRTA